MEIVLLKLSVSVLLRCAKVGLLCAGLFTYKKKSMVWVRERTIPTGPPVVGEVIANFCG
jgi:hypothetical protein